MSKPGYSFGEPFQFSLPDGGSGGETRTASEFAVGSDYVLAVLLRSHYCSRSRRLVQGLADEYERFAARSIAVVPVLPARRERAAVWHRRYDLPFSILADCDEERSDADQLASFGVFDPFVDAFDARPGGVLFETDGDVLRFHRTFGDEEPLDASGLDELLSGLEIRGRRTIAGPVASSRDVGSLGGS